MAKERKDNGLFGNKAIGIAGSSLAVGGGATLTDYFKENKKFKQIKGKSTKVEQDFIRSLKKGDILMRSEAVKGIRESAFAGLHEPGKFIDVANDLDLGDIIKMGGGGNKYSHAGIYLGNGKVAESFPDKVVINDISTYTNKGRSQSISLRLTEDKATQKKIADTARQLVKINPSYRGVDSLVKDTLKKNLSFAKFNPDGKITCTEFAEKATTHGSGKRLISTFRASPQDIFESKKLKVASSYNYTKSDTRSKITQFIGKNFRNGKFYIVGAGLGAATALGMHIYSKMKKERGGELTSSQKKAAGSLLLGGIAAAAGAKYISNIPIKKKGRWVTMRGRRVFIRG